MKKKFLSILLALCLCLTLLPTAAFADETCTHSAIDETTGKCSCGKTFVASITKTDNTKQYFEDFRSALNAVDTGETLTLLNNATDVSGDRTLGKSFTLDLNGKTVSEAKFIIAFGQELTLKGAANSKLRKSVQVVDGTLKVAEAVTLGEVSVNSGNITVDADAEFTKLSITGGTATLNGGTFTTLEVGGNDKLSDKITLGEGKALRSDDTWYTGDGLKVQSLSNVSVQTVPIKSLSISADKTAYTYGEEVTLTAEVSLATGYNSNNVTYAWLNADGNSQNLPQTSESITLDDLTPHSDDNKYTIRCTVTVDGYSLSNYIEFTVSKATLTDKYTAPTAKTDLTYDDSDQELINAGSFGSNVTITGSNAPKFWYGMENANGGMEWSTVKNGRDAGTYTVYWYIAGGTNYNDVGSMSTDDPAGTFTVTIAPQSVEPTVEVADGGTFNGGEKKPTVTVTADSKTLTKDTDYTVSYENNINAGTDTAKVTVTAKQGSNYTWTPAVEKTFSIAKAAARTLDNITVNRKYTTTGAQSTQIGSIMPADAGTLSYSVGSSSVSGTATVSSFTVSDSGLVKYTITGGAVGAVITLPVKINSTNYAESTVNVVITLTEKDTQEALNITSANSVTYGQTLTLSTSGGSGTGAVSYAVVSGGTGGATISGSTLTTTKVGTVQVKATKAADDDYTSVESAVVTITINKATPTGAPKYTAITTSGKKLSDAGLAVNEGWPDGTITWVDADGNALSGETAVEANKSYRWKFTPTDGDNYNAIDGSVTLWNYTPPTVIVPSTSVTVPVSSDSGKVEVKAEVSKGNATVEISDKQIEQVAANGSGTVTVDVSKLEKVESVSVPAHVVDTTNKAEDTGLTVALPSGSVALDETALESVSTGKDVAVSVKRVPATDLNEAQQKAVGDMANIGLVVDVDLFVGAEKQSTFNGGKLTISVPYTPKRGEDVSKLTVWFIRDDGTIENMGGYYDAAKGCFVFETGHLSRYLLVSVNEQFSDVAPDAYYAAAVNWAAKQNITGGIGNNLFAPDASCTRAQIVTFLWRAAGSPEPKAESSFADVPADAYYAKAVAWAVENGITTGTSETTFSPDATCMRAQAVTFLYRSEQANGGGFTGAWMFRLPFGDVPEWCYGAVAWCYMNGITGGTSETTFSPNAGCTRAQIVTMLYRLLSE